jgi:sRNA-binding carbon storage regulator CsrA
MGLIISRRIGEEFVLFPAAGIDPAELAEQLAEGITIRINNAVPGKAWIDIDAPRDISILRTELLTREPS